MRKGLRAPVPSLKVPLSPNLHVFTKQEAPQTLSFGGFMEASLHKHHWLNHWPLVVEINFELLSPPRRLGATRSSNPPGTCLPELATSSQPLIFSKSHLFMQQKTYLWFSLLRKLQGFQELCARDRDKDKMYLFPIASYSFIDWYCWFSS